MKHPFARMATTGAVTAAVALGSSLIAAGPAHAETSVWNCTQVGSVAVAQAFGLGCSGNSNRTGPGLIELNGSPRYRCTNFVSSGTDPNTNVGGLGCNFDFGN